MIDKKVLIFLSVVFLFPAFLSVSGQVMTTTREREVVSVSTPGTTNRVVSRVFEYYPEAQVYFSVGANTWFWQEDGVWRSGPELPLTVRLPEMMEYVLIDSDTPYGYVETRRVPKMARNRFPSKFRMARKGNFFTRKTFDYIYYPEYGVYLDTLFSSYLWVENGAWKYSRIAPPNMPVYLTGGEPVSLDSELVQLH